MTHTRARRVTAAVLAVVFGIGVSASCTSDVPAVPEVPSTAAIDSETPMVPSPSPSPTAMPTNDPANPDSWVVSPAGIGPVNVTDDYQDVLDEIRAAGVGPLDCEGVAYGYADDNAYDIMVIKDRRDDSGEVVEVSVSWNGDTMGVGPRTAEDLGLGSTKSQVLGTYETAEESSSAIPDHSFVTIADKNGEGTLVFSYLDSYDGAVSVSVITGEEPAYEPCA